MGAHQEFNKTGTWRKHEVVTGFTAKNPSGVGKFFSLSDEDAENYGQPPSIYDVQIKQTIGRKGKSE